MSPIVVFFGKYLQSWQMLAKVVKSCQMLAIVDIAWEKLLMVANSWQKLPIIAKSCQTLPKVIKNIKTLRHKDINTKRHKTSIPHPASFNFCYLFRPDGDYQERCGHDNSNNGGRVGHSVGRALHPRVVAALHYTRLPPKHRTLNPFSTWETPSRAGENISQTHLFRNQW